MIMTVSRNLDGRCHVTLLKPRPHNEWWMRGKLYRFLISSCGDACNPEHRVHKMMMMMTRTTKMTLMMTIMMMILIMMIR